MYNLHILNTALAVSEKLEANVSKIIRQWHYSYFNTFSTTSNFKNLVLFF